VILDGLAEQGPTALKQGHALAVGSCSRTETFLTGGRAVKLLDLKAVEYTMLLTFAQLVDESSRK
jgi:hypothetical protein